MPSTCRADCAARLAWPSRLFLALAIGLAGSAHAATGSAAAPPPATPASAAQATLNAFDLLLSLPQGVRQGNEFPVHTAEGVTRPTNEKELLAALADEVAAGADVNAYQHGGTLLLHAIRAGLDDTALWLLDHRAKPSLEVNGDAGPGDGHDALQLAIVYQRWRVVDALLQRRGVAPATDLDRARRWQAVFDARREAPDAQDAADAREVTARGLAKRVPWPGGWPGACLLAAAADQGIVPMLLASTARAPRRFTADEEKALPPAERAIATTCPADTADARMSHRHFGHEPRAALSTVPAAELARLDARLDDPLLPVLVPMIGTPADAAAWAALPMRRPWSDAAFSRRVLLALLREDLPPEARTVALHGVPAGALGAALDDDTAMEAWFERLATLHGAEAATALAAVDDATLRRHVEAAITGLAKGTTGLGYAPSIGHPAADTSTWQALLARLPAPLQLRPSIGVLRLVPEPAWPALFARGYVPDADQVHGLWRERGVDQWRVGGPPLRATVPAPVLAAARDAILAEWTQACDSEWQAPRADDVVKLQEMDVLAMRPARPVAISESCARRGEPAAMKSLADAGLVSFPAFVAQAVALAAAPAPAGFAPRRTTCDATPSVEIVRALLRRAWQADDRHAHERYVAYEGADADGLPASVQAVDVPGARACAWLVSGGIVSARIFDEEEDFYIGAWRNTPCGDVTLYGELWREAGDKLVAQGLGEGATTGALALDEIGGPRRFLLTLAVGGDTCDGGHAGRLYEWTAGPDGPRLVARAEGDPAWAALAKACPLEDPGPCFGLVGERGGPAEDATADAASGSGAPPARPLPKADPPTVLSLADFLAAHDAPLRRRWIDAFLALDVPALTALDKDGVAPAWRRSALAALTASPLPLPEKRRRIAWLFRDHAGLKESFDGRTEEMPEVTDLVAWLPREDWRPLLDAIGGNQAQWGALTGAATQRNDAALACTFSRAKGEPCAAGAR